MRWRIKRADAAPMAAACIWERFINTETGEILFSFSMLTIHANGHEIMQHFHKPTDEKRSIVVLDDDNYHNWLQADTKQAQSLLNLSANGFLTSEPAPR